MSDAKPLWDCGDSNHFGVYLTGEELEEAAAKVGLADDNDYRLCLNTVETMLPTMADLAHAAGVERTPTVLVNCQYEVPIDKVLAAVCQINEQLDVC